MESSNAYCRRATSAIVEQVAATSPAVSGRISCSSYSSSLPPPPTTLTGLDSLLLLLRAGGKTSAVVKKCRLPRVYTTTAQWHCQLTVRPGRPPGIGVTATVGPRVPSQDGPK